jgi:hypothetical protein
MKNIFYKSRQKREIKRLAKENKGKALRILDDGVFKLLFSSGNEDSRKALCSLLSTCTRRVVTAVQIKNNEPHT